MNGIWFCILWNDDGEYANVDDWGYTTEAAADRRAEELNLRDGYKNTNSGKEWHWDTGRLDVRAVS